MKGLTALAAAAVIAAVIAGCGGSGKNDVQLDLSTNSTAGKALVLTATTTAKLASQKRGLYALELRGIDTDSSGASFDHPTYVDPSRCVGGSGCEWTLAPSKAGKYSYEVVLLDLVHDKTAGESNAVNVSWAPPSRPEAITLFVNGKTPKTTPLSQDNYSDFPAGAMRVEAKWTTDARGTGYYVRISDDAGISATCSAGTSCRIPKAVPLAVGQEDSWTLELLTKRGNKIAGGFKVCLTGVKKSKAT
jgi:hypothetical protein